MHADMREVGGELCIGASKSLYLLKGHESELDECAGERVIIAGAVNGNAIRVESVAPVGLMLSTRSIEGE